MTERIDDALSFVDEVRTDERLCRVVDLVRATETALSRAGAWSGSSFGTTTREARALVTYGLGVRQLRLELLDAAVTTSERSAVLDLLERRIRTRTPLPYLVGEAWYAGLRLAIRSGVFIPRNVFERVLDDLLASVSWSEQPRMLDLCTGSGALGLAAAVRRQDVLVDMADLSPDAVAVATENVRRHRLTDRIEVFEGDLFAPVPADRRYDLITMNPPYIPDAQRSTVLDEVHHEPDVAFYGRGDGLDLVRSVLLSAPDHLASKGTLAIEIGRGEQSREVDWILGGRGRWWSDGERPLGLVTVTHDDLVR